MAGIDATTWLFVPGNAPHRFDKAAAAGADAVVIDLEDAVRPEDKDTALADTLRWLTGGRAWVRVGTARDVDAVAGAAGLLGVIVPKAEEPSSLASVAARLDVPVVALIETAVGLRRVYGIAATADRLAFGSLDMAADLLADDSRDAMLLARDMIVLASRVAGLPPPIDGVTTVIHDAETVEESARYARSLGFRGRFCIHPAQLGPTARGLAPDEDEIAWARQVLGAAEGSAGAVTGPDGHLVDKPVVDRARAILQAGRASHAPS
jgi:citrate lyase subunit beta / citryl-CoA lyase